MLCAYSSPLLGKKTGKQNLNLFILSKSDGEQYNNYKLLSKKDIFLQFILLLVYCNECNVPYHSTENNIIYHSM